jgi:hypothetical protein
MTGSAGDEIVRQLRISWQEMVDCEGRPVMATHKRATAAATRELMQIEVAPSRPAKVRSANRAASGGNGGATVKRASATPRSSHARSNASHAHGADAEQMPRSLHTSQPGNQSRKDAPRVAPKSSSAHQAAGTPEKPLAKSPTKAPKQSAAPAAAAKLTTPVAQLPLLTVVRPAASAASAHEQSAAPLHGIPAEEEEATTPTSELPPQVQATVRRKFGELRAAIAEGFEIMEPIYARPLWSAPDNSRIAYSFVLQRESMTRLITVPGGRTVQQFIRERDLQVDYRR